MRLANQLEDSIQVSKFHLLLNVYEGKKTVICNQPRSTLDAFACSLVDYEMRIRQSLILSTHPAPNETHGVHLQELTSKTADTFSSLRAEPHPAWLSCCPFYERSNSSNCTLAVARMPVKITCKIFHIRKMACNVACSCPILCRHSFLAEGSVR